MTLQQKANLKTSLREYWLISKAIYFRNWQSGAVSRVRKEFIALNIAEDKKLELQKEVTNNWNLLRLINAAVVASLPGDHAPSSYEDFLRRRSDELEKIPDKQTQLDEFLQWRMMHPEWIDFEITPSERQELANAKT